MSMLISRRDMLRTAAVAAGVWTISGNATRAQSTSPNERLNIAGIGSGGAATASPAAVGAVSCRAGRAMPCE